MRWPIRRRSHAAAAALIVGYVLLWWVYAVIAKGSQDIHFDMGEVVSWSLVPAYGYPKHPPFPGLGRGGLVRGISLRGLGVLPALHGRHRRRAVVRLADRRALRRRRQARARADVADLSPGFNFQPLKFNSNALLIPVWAAASYLFLRSFAERSRAVGRARRRRRRARDADQVLVDLPHSRLRRGGARASASAGTICARPRHGPPSSPARCCSRRTSCRSSPTTSGRSNMRPSSHVVMTLRRAARARCELSSAACCFSPAAWPSSCWPAGRMAQRCATC